MRKFLLLTGLVIVSNHFFGQAFNGDPGKSFINIIMPKTPESQGIEKYGNTQINENTGTPNITIPLFNLKSKFIEVPISLSYNASGIRVDHEASATGLGWDLIAGGRITVQVKGSLDDNSRWNLIVADTFKAKFQKIVNRLNNGNGKAILTYLSNEMLCNASGDCSYYDTIYDHTKTAEAMAWFGAGEPDVYQAYFMGHTLSFYYDIATDELKWLGEKSLFSVSSTKDSYGRIKDWIVTDNSGIRYYFYQQESSLMSTTPNGMGISQYESTTAWLLTKILHPSGDSVNFTYTNFGKTYPVTTPSASASLSENDHSTYSLSPDYPKDQAELKPAYLTKIESSVAKIDVLMDVRDDLKGAGARRVTQIIITDKNTNQVKKIVNFRHSYFSGTLESYHTPLHDSVTKYMKYRLRLDSLYIMDSAISHPYRFYYYTPSGLTIPEKLSFSQDHWGYYNGRNNNSTYLSAGSPANLIPTTYSLQLEGMQRGYSANLDGYGDRRASAAHMPVMTLDSLVYPTGGATKFSFEPHQTDYFGGGLRVKRTIDYGSDNNIVGTIDYLYEDGYYAGVLDYTKITTEHVITGYPEYYNISNVLYKKYTISSIGAIDYGRNLIGYGKVTKIQKNLADVAANGKVVKYFKPTYKSGSDCGIEERPPHHPIGLYCGLGQCLTYVNNTDRIFAEHCQLPGTTSEMYDGMPIKEEFFDASNNKLRSVEYFYSRAAYSKDIYSLKAFDGYANGPSVGSFPGAPDMTPYVTVDFRRFLLFASPAKSYYTLTDSIIERTYQGAKILVTKKAFKYNNHYQPEYTSVYNSDGTQTITYTRTPLAFARPNSPSTGVGDATLIEQMRSSHIYDVPIEQISLERSEAGDTTVLGAVYNVYDYGSLKDVYSLETNALIPFRSNFIPTYYFNNYPTVYDWYLVKDDRYVLQESASYNTGMLINDITTKKGIKSFIWDELYNTVLAQCVNASSLNIAFSSFETSAKGSWEYNGIPQVELECPTGAKVYNLAGGAIIRQGLDISETYIVSFWKKAGASVSISGASIQSTSAGRVFGEWTYTECIIANTSSFSISGSGLIDELRLYPQNAFMTTYCHKPLVGLWTQCDPNNRITYYEYDEFSRLVIVRYPTD